MASRDHPNVLRSDLIILSCNEARRDVGRMGRRSAGNASPRTSRCHGPPHQPREAILHLQPKLLQSKQLETVRQQAGHFPADGVVEGTMDPGQPVEERTGPLRPKPGRIPGRGRGMLDVHVSLIPMMVTAAQLIEPAATVEQGRRIRLREALSAGRPRRRRPTGLRRKHIRRRVG